MGRFDDEEDMEELDASEDVLPEEATDADISDRAAELLEEPGIAEGLFEEEPPIMLPEAAPIAPGIDPMTGMPVEAAAIEQPAAPVMVPQKQGSTTTSTTTQVESAESQRLAGEVEQNRAALQQTGDVQIKSAEAVDKAQADLDVADSKVIQEIEGSRAAVRQAGIEKLQADLQQIDQRVAELSNLKPEKFWDSKSTADKIASAISIGLGSFGAALTGSGQNIGQVLLDRQMNEFDRAQRQKYESKVKQIEGMRTSAKDKAALIDEQDKIFDAQKLAGLAQVKGLYARQLQMAKTPGVAAKIQQDTLKLNQQILQSQQQIAAGREQKIKSTQQRDEIKMIQQQPGMDKDGKPLKLTEGQAKARNAYADMSSSNQATKGLNIEKIASSPAYQLYLRSTQTNQAIEAVPGLGNFVSKFGDMMTGTPNEVLAKGKYGTDLGQNPDAARLNNAIDNWVDGLIRYKTGAAIQVMEKKDERAKYWPEIGDTPKMLQDKAVARKAMEKAVRQAGALE